MIKYLNSKSAYIIIFLFSVQFLILAQDKTIYAVRVSTPPVIDGILSDSVWNLAKPVSDFTQQEPIAGAKATFKTVVRILYDEKNLYVSFMCYDDEPDKIIARALKLDGAWGADDNIALFFDTFNDDRNAYWFGTNPLGMRDDALLTSSSGFGGFHESWHGVWNVNSAIVDSGWSTEMIFPFSTFKFFDTDIQHWGVNFQRKIQRLGESDQWTAIGKDLEFHRIAFAGDLLGIEGIKRGNPVYLKPFLTAGAERNGTENSYIHKGGLDVKYGITQSLSLDLTFNTDFAQVESDRSRINLSRFPLFFPEKRDFFLEGANVFDFSFGGNNNLFYSRRIGIHNGKEIPIIAGAKLVGRANNMEIGFIDMQTRNEDILPTTNYGVARVKYDVFDQSYIGGFISNRISKDDYNRSFGTDALFTTNTFLRDKTLSIGTNIAKTDKKHGAKNSWAGRVYIDYPNDLIDQFMAYTFVQENFNPGIGFVSRTGIQSYDYNLNISPRINLGIINKLQFTPIESVFILDKDNNLLGADMEFKPIGFSTIHDDNFSFEINREFDFVQTPFDIFENTVIPAGKYWYTTLGASLRTGRGRPLYGTIEFSAGDYYTGKRKSFYSQLNWISDKQFTLSVDYQRNEISLSQRDFTTNEIGTNLSYDFSTKTHSSVFAQWNNGENELNINYRFNWEPEVGSNFYLVINHLMDTQGKLKTKDIAILAKVVWLFII